jgi:endosialidase-like protein
MNSFIQVRKTIPIFLVTLLCFGPLQKAQAVSPPPDGGYPGHNTAEGTFALLRLTTGINNTANGFGALQNNTTGGNNTANGSATLYFNTTGEDNTATGAYALFANATGDDNVANGAYALSGNRTGHANTATGYGALYYNTTGNNNIALGFHAGFVTTASNNIDIGNVGVMGESATIRIGTARTHMATFIAGISGAPVMNGVQVMVNSNGKLGTMLSSARFKEAIKPMDKASEAILALQPVTFRYKPDLDPDGIPQFGLIAEQVEKVNPHLVAHDADGKVNTVRYEAVNAMLLNEFLKEHQSVQELKSAAAKQEATIAHQQKQIEALTAGLQKVSAQIELSKRAPQTVLMITKAVNQPTQP